MNYAFFVIKSTKCIICRIKGQVFIAEKRTYDLKAECNWFFDDAWVVLV